MTFETLLPWLLVTGGILCLGLGGSWLVDGASRIALKLGISPMVVGLTVVGFGTSMPEFSVSLMAALRGSGGLSLGNAVGSNIMNLLLVLGVAAVLVPIHVIGSRRLLYRDLSFGLVPAVVLIVFALVMILLVRREINRVLETSLAEHDLSAIPDGAHEGTEAYLGKVFALAVEVKAGRIERIQVRSDDGREYSTKARSVLAKVVEAQSLEVDAATGATVTSKVFLNAVNDALTRAATR